MPSTFSNKNRSQANKSGQAPTDAKSPTTGRVVQGSAGPLGTILQMQRTYGNQAVQKMLQSYTQQPPVQKQTEPPIQRALVRDQEILDRRTGHFNWVDFRGERDDDDKSNPAEERGRGAKLTNNADAKTKVNWSEVDAESGEGQRMEAIVGPDHNLGSGPTEPHALERVKAFKLLSGKSYISGHLLNEKLGGPGNDARNLTAISQKANALDAQNIEKFVRDPVNDTGAWYKYIVSVDYSDASGVYNKPSDEFVLNELDFTPSGVEWKAKGSKKTEVSVRYASRLNATWYALNTDGNRYGPEYKTNVTIQSPLAGGKAGLETPSKNSKISAKAPKNRGTEAKTEIDAEELVLTTGNLLKSVVENREGLIDRLNEIRENNAELLEESEELQDLVYHYGYDWGYDDGYQSYSEEDPMAYYQDDGENGGYSAGYDDGFKEGQEAAKQYAKGHNHGYDDGYYDLADTEDSRMDAMNQHESYHSGYHDGVGDGKYQQLYDQGDQDGEADGKEDVPKHYWQEGQAYMEGYDAGYARGQLSSGFRAGQRYQFFNMTLAHDPFAGMQNVTQTFYGKFWAELTGNKVALQNKTWYEMKILDSDHQNLQKDNVGWMKREWTYKGH